MNCAVKVVSRGLRGFSFAEIARQTGAYGVLPGDSDLQVMAKFGSWVGATYGTTAPVLGLGAHAYWRIKILATNGGSNVNIGNIEFRATPGGIDQAFDGTAISGGNFNNDFVEAYAFDDNPNSLWYSAQGATGWIGYHFPGPVNVGEVLIHYGYRDDPVAAPRDFFIEYSDDGAAWTTGWLVQGSSGWAQGEDRLFRPPD